MFSSRIKELRLYKNLTQSELAQAIDITQSDVSKYERGQLEPNIRTIRQICSFFNVSADFLLGLEDDESLQPAVPYSTPILTEDEKELVDTFRRMTPNLQKIAIDTLHSFAGDRETQRSDGSIATRKA